MHDTLARLHDIFAPLNFSELIRALIILVLGWFIARLVSVGLVHLLRKYTAAQESMILRRTSFYLIFGLAAVMALNEMGFNLSIFLGAAGILTVAIGFASQTSASNLISGLFLIGERSFVVGDVIKVGETTGEVLSVDLLSVKLRTFDNLFVRVPNESLVKSEIVNLSRFPLRRVDLTIGVDYKEELEKVREVLFEVAESNPLCLIDPKPLFIILGFGDSSIDLQFSVWARRENFLDLKNSIQMEIKKAFDEHDISIPYPQRMLQWRQGSEAVPIVREAMQATNTAENETE